MRTRPPRADLRPVALRSCIHGNVAGEVGEIGVVDAAGRGAAAIAAAAGGGKAGAGASFLGDCATSARRWSSSLLCPPPAPPPRPSRSLLSGVGPPTGAAFAVSHFVSVAAWEEREREREKKRGRAGRQVAVVVARSRTGLLISESEQREVYFPRALVSATARGISPRGSRDLRPRGKTRRTREDAPSSVYASSWRPSRAARRASLRRAGEATTGGRTDGITRVSGAFARGNDRGRASFMREIRGRGLARDAPARAPRPRNRCDAAAKAFSNVSSAMSSREARATRRTARRDASRTREGTRGDAPVASARGSGSEREWRRADDGVCGSANDGDGTAVSGGDRGRRARRRRARRRRARDVARRARTVAVATVSPLPCTLIRRRLKKPRGFRARARSPAASRVRARRRARGRERCLW